MREGFELLESIGETGYLSSLASLLAEAIYMQKRYEEAERFSEVSEQNAAPEDLASQASWRSTRAAVLAQRGEAEKAEGLAREAVDIARRTDYLNMHAGLLACARRRPRHRWSTGASDPGHRRGARAVRPQRATS